MASSKLYQAYEEQNLDLVDMNDVKFLPFSPNGPLCLGTMHLNSCTAVAIVSRSGAILAHIAPRSPNGDPNEATGDEHARMMMSRMRQVLAQNRNHFSNQGTYSVVMYAMYQGEVALYDQVRNIAGKLQSWNLPPRYAEYEVRPAYLCGPAKGTVMVDARGQVPVVWLEDARVA